MENVKQFIDTFHNLEGSTVGEKRKSFFLLLNNFTSSNSETVNEIIVSLIPKTHLETLFRVELLLFFKRSTELFDVLKSGNEQLASKIFKNRWFFQHPFDELSADEIVNDLLPSLSFVTRNKVIRWLAKYHKNETKLDVFFDALLERYGIQTAKLIVPGCSPRKMETIFITFPLVLPVVSLRLVFNKNMPAFKVYMKNCFSYHEDYPKIAQDMILKEPEMYFEMICRYNVQLGKKATRRLLVYDKDRIVANASNFVTAHLKTVYKFLCRNDAVLFFRNLFPVDLSNFWSENVSCFLKYFPKSEQFWLFLETFESVYGKSLCDHPKQVRDFLLTSIEDADERQKWVELVIKFNNKPDDYVQYYAADKAIGLCKKKLLSTNNCNIQFNMVKQMLLTCRINNDVSNLSEVLEFIHKHFKSKENWFKRQILVVFNSQNVLHMLKKEHWDIVISLCKNFKLEREYARIDKQIYLKYIEYLWKTKQQADDAFIELLKSNEISLYDYRAIKKPDKLDKYLLDLVVKNFSKIFEEVNHPSEAVECMMWMQAWNTRHPKCKMSAYDFPELVAAAIKYLNDKSNLDDYLTDALMILVCDHSHSDLRNAVIDIYLRLGCGYRSSPQLPLWLLKFQPETLSGCSQYFIKTWCHNLSDNRIIWEYVKKLRHYDLYEKAITYCMENYTSESHCSFTVIYLLKVMAYLMCPEDFVNAMMKHVPKTERIDIDDENSKADYQIESCVAVALKYTKSVIVLPTLVKFCKGDYLGSALESLYYLFYHSPEKQLGALLDELSTRAVSVRKHVFFLTSQVGSVNSMIDLLKSAGEHEKNVSVKKHILNTILRYFNKNPFDESFELLKKWIPTLNVSDTESLESLVRLRDIPAKYRSRFFVFMLEYLILRADESVEIRKFLNDFLGNFDKHLVKELPLDFCVSILEKYFLVIENAHFSQRNINDFIINYWLYSGDDCQRKTDLILNRVLEYKSTPEMTLEAKISVYKHIEKFMNCCICFISWFHEKVDKQLIDSLHDTWLQLFTVEDFFNVYIKLKVMMIQIESKDTETYSKKIFAFSEEINLTYGPNFIKELALAVKFCLRWDAIRGDKLYILCKHLWLCSQSVINCMLILYLLPTNQPDTPKTCDEYFALLDSLEKHSDTSVKVLFNNYVKLVEMSH